MKKIKVLKQLKQMLGSEAPSCIDCEGCAIDWRHMIEIVDEALAAHKKSDGTAESQMKMFKIAILQGAHKAVKNAEVTPNYKDAIRYSYHKMLNFDPLVSRAFDALYKTANDFDSQWFERTQYRRMNNYTLAESWLDRQETLIRAIKFDIKYLKQERT